jgi:hypothetical protein
MRGGGTTKDTKDTKLDQKRGLNGEAEGAEVGGGRIRRCKGDAGEHPIHSSSPSLGSPPTSVPLLLCVTLFPS